MGTIGQSVTLANSIIGVGILAMPFCFQQCGIVLATLILLFMGLVSRLCCHLLLKSALIARRRSFEFLAFHTFGPLGKLAVEMGIIGFLMGTCIAYFVVVGDLGPQIISKMFNINQSDILRTSIMVLVSLLCVLPLGLLRNVDSLSNVSAATIGFYFCLVIKVISEAASCMWRTDWQSRVQLWRPDGFLQCVPIFSMALFCQTQLFEIFESLPTLSLEKMNLVTQNAIHICTGVYFTLGLFGYIAFHSQDISGKMNLVTQNATNICTGVYFTLGLFGYIAFHSQDISGNILMSLSPTMASDVIKLGFVMSLAFSFPLVIFPCRASLYSFLYKKIQATHHDHMINNSIPASTFRCMTVGIIAVALCVSLLLPNIELVLGLLGSTIGVLVCVVFPAACFVTLTAKDTNERILAKGVIILGLVILVLGTYANLQAAESRVDRYEADDRITPERIDKIVEDFFERMEREDGFKPVSKTNLKLASQEKLQREDSKDSEIQPPNPVPPDTDDKNDKPNEPIKETVAKKTETKIIPEKPKETASESHPKNLKGKLNGAKINNEEKQPQIEKQENKIEEVKPSQDKAQEKNDDIIKQQQLIETIKQHGEEQKELIKEQKEILDELVKAKKELQQNKKDVDTVDAKKLAVESIQKIANVAIKSLSLVTEPPKGEKKSEDAEVLEKIADEVKKAIEAIVETKENKDEENKNIKPNIVKTEVNGVQSNNYANNNNPQQKNVPQINIPNANQQAQETQNNVPVNNFAPAIPAVAQILNAPDIKRADTNKIHSQNNIPQSNLPINIPNANQQTQNIQNNIPNLNSQVNNFAAVNPQANIQNNVQISNSQPNVNNIVPVNPQANPQMNLPNTHQQAQNIQNNIPNANSQPNVNFVAPIKPQPNSDVNILNANSQPNVNNFVPVNAQANPQMNLANANQQSQNIQNNANLQPNVNNFAPVNPQANPQPNMANTNQQAQNVKNNNVNLQPNLNNFAPVNAQANPSMNIANDNRQAQNIQQNILNANPQLNVNNVAPVIPPVPQILNSPGIPHAEALIQNFNSRPVKTNQNPQFESNVAHPANVGQVQNQPIKQNIETEIVKNEINQNQLNPILDAKPHLHSADEPQSYKVGEDLQTAEMAKNVAENIPIPIALKGQIKAKQIERNNLNKEQNVDRMKNLQNVENMQNEEKSAVENNAGHIRQKREVVDCTQKSLLAPEDIEVCKAVLDTNKVKTDKIETSVKKFEDKNLEISNNNNEFKSEAILLSKVDLNEGLNRVPVELIHHVRSLKSYEENEKR